LKLSANINLDPIKQDALARLDAAYAPLMQTLHAEKLKWAKQDGDHPALVAEAAMRGITVSELKMQIIQNAARAEEELVRIEVERQRQKHHIRNATSEKTLR
jgi:putative protein kinase ArgK-like GTPase of G3E family